MGLVGDRQVTESERYAETEGDDQSTYLEPTQKLSDVKNLALFPD
jgi:hypothetical protein